MRKESFSFQVGSFKCIVVSDGTFSYPHPAQVFFANAPKRLLAQSLRKHSIDLKKWDQYVTPYLCLVIQTGQQKVLVDTGADGLAPTTGKLIQNLKREGIFPEDIDIVILTHAHPDHIGGNIDSDGKPAFPNARYIMWKDEWDFWISKPDLKELKIDEHIKEILITYANKNLTPLQDRIELIDQEKEVVPGIKVIKAFGHTPGHTAVAITENNERLLCISDAVLLQLHLEQPNWYAAVDFNPKEAITTRQRLLERAIDEQSMILAFHFPFPGLGYVIRKGEGWEWNPISTF